MEMANWVLHLLVYLSGRRCENAFCEIGPFLPFFVIYGFFRGNLSLPCRQTSPQIGLDSATVDRIR
jgi:hypothetical protein